MLGWAGLGSEGWEAWLGSKPTWQTPCAGAGGRPVGLRLSGRAWEAIRRGQRLALCLRLWTEAWGCPACFPPMRA